MMGQLKTCGNAHARAGKQQKCFLEICEAESKFRVDATEPIEPQSTVCMARQYIECGT
jgi:hypothetical protein